ncbi:Protein TPX2 [Hibiscus syriacus]|uniref:Protein TPX2 n=1 Tax=Hibiscus syriacus TaxID=106335 RepID=A0A6A3AJY1_HIBSY|nr:Protein TPX2 [Hibiscus syriacus]
MDESSATAPIDEFFEFSAPSFFDFMKGESEEETRNAELWFETALSYAPSPFMARIKTGSRYFQVESLCNFSKEDQLQKASESSGETASNSNSEDKTQAKFVPDKVNEEIKPSGAKITNEEKDKENIGTVCAQANGSALSEKSHLNASGDEEKSKSTVKVETEACTPKPLMNSQKKPVSDKKRQTAKRIASTIRNSSVLKPKTGNVGAPNLALESQAIKRQKLDGGRSRQILDVKPQNLPHKSKLALDSGSSNLNSSTTKTSSKLDRKVYVREQEAPFVSMAEMMNKFQSCTRDLSLPGSSLSNVNKQDHIILAPIRIWFLEPPCFLSSFTKFLPTNQDNASTVQMPMLKLTRPKEPEFETAHRMHPVRVKSTAELEEEMMAKIPKFKARPLNKKIFEASTTLTSLPRSTPVPPEFQEFHFETTARASKDAETSSVASMEVSRQNNEWKPQLTEPKSPLLQTSLRAKPPKVKSSIELEQEELEKAPKFKARPLNKKIFESKGELGIFCNAKKQMTIPQEFHFATHERIPPPPVAVFDLLDKLSLNSESRHDPISRNTIPNPFHLHTEERGAEKEKKFVREILEKQFEEEQARVPKATSYPYTTDYPVVCPSETRTEAVYKTGTLPIGESGEARGEDETRDGRKKEEALMRVFKAQPVLKEDPLPVPEKVRKPLTQVEEFDLNVNHRAVDRAEFDQKIKEKEMIYKRYREESEAARMIEEEKALKQLRRTMVPHARPVPKFDHPFCPQRSSKETTKPISQRELEDEASNAELWFETALSYAPSPFMSRIKAGSRSFHVESLCNFSEEDQMQKASESSDATPTSSNLEDKPKAELVPDEIVNDDKDKENTATVCAQENGSALTEKSRLNVPDDEEKSKSTVQTAKKIASMIRNPSVLKPKTCNAGTPNLALENQAIKRQKLDGGRSRQILNVKPYNLPHKSKLGLPSGSSNRCSSTAETSNKLDRKVYVREQAPFVSMAEMMRKFQSSTRDLSLPHSSLSNTTKKYTKPPEFQEFHLETIASASKNAETSSVASTEVYRQLSLNSESSHDPIPRKTIPNPFHLHTEERGAEKEKKFVMEIIEQQFEEATARVPKANPYPYTTDYPVIPPKPEPKHCTKPEPFQLESLVRHEEEMKREMEERRKKRERRSSDESLQGSAGSKRRNDPYLSIPYHAILCRDPISVPEKPHKPLTQVQEFDLHIKEKETVYKRYREESEVARMIEEEKALKQLRRTMVPHARPVPKFDHPFCPQKSSKETTKPKS